MPLYVFYTMVQKSKKWPKTQLKAGGPAWRQDPLDLSFYLRTIFMKLGTLVHHVHGYKILPQIF